MNFTSDTIHPNDRGHKIYADCIISRLNEYAEKASGEIVEHPIPAPLSDKTFDNAGMTECWKMDGYKADGFAYVDESLCGHFHGYIEGKNPGDSISFEFTGDTFGLYYMMAEDSGNIICSVDGVDKTVFSTWDSFCKSFRRANGGTVISGLEYGRHTVNLRISEQKAEESTGTAIRISTILYS